MKKILSALLLVLLCTPVYGQGKGYKVEDIPNVQLSDSRRFVSNPDGLLSSGAVYRIDTMLLSLRQTNRAQVAVVAVNSIGNADPTDFLFKLLEKWGVGRRDIDNGLGILLVIDQGAIEILTGYGLEGDLPDAILKRVINNYMLPAFREKDWDGGMVAGVGAIKSILDGAIPADIAAAEEEENPWFVFMAIALVMLIPAAVLFTVAFFSNRCPRCKKRTLKRTSSRIVKKNGRKVEETTYICSNCGYVVIKDRDHHDNSGIGPIIGGGMLGGGMGRGGGFGGGSSGGSWGGGSFGGGGARGRF